MKTVIRGIGAFFCSLLVAGAISGCSAAPDDAAPAEATGSIEQALSTCISVCTPTTSCSQSCYIDAAAQPVYMTCGQFGRCGTPVPPVPVCIVQCVERGQCQCPTQVCQTTTSCCTKWQTVCQ